MMIRDQNGYPEFPRFPNTRDARNTIVDRHDQGWIALRGDSNDFRRQTVAVLEAIGNDVTNVGKPIRLEAAQQQRCAGRTVHIKIAYNNDAFIAMLHQEFNSVV